MQDMKDVFYIIKVREDFYQVRLKFNYECIATAFSLEEALERIKVLVERYNTLDNLIMKWKASDMRPSKPDQISRNKEEYEERGHEFEIEINKVFDQYKPKLLTKRSKLLKSTTPKVNDAEQKVKNVPEAKNNILLKPKKKILFKK